MAFIKQESEDFKIEEVFSMKQEDTEEQTGLIPLKKESEVLNEMKEKDQEYQVEEEAKEEEEEEEEEEGEGEGEEEEEEEEEEEGEEDLEEG
ncbi:unnamed protein product [Leuciscus chuanchicus]